MLPSFGLKIKEAKCPQDVFPDYLSLGIEPALAALKKFYVEQILLFHPDKVDEKYKSEAENISGKLNALYEEAQASIRLGKWDRPKSKSIIQIGKNSLYLAGQVYRGTFCNCFVTEGGELIKIPRSAKDNPKVTRESEVLKEVWKNTRENAQQFFPELRRTIKLARPDGERVCNIFPHFSEHHPDRGYTLQEVINAYPGGVDLRNAAWMLNRLLVAIGTLHYSDYVHANLTPDNFIIFPETHYGMLVGFTSAVKNGEKSDTVSEYSAPEVGKSALTPASDLWSAIKIIRKVLGKTPITPRMEGLFKSCEMTKHRNNDAFEVFNDFKDALFRHFGPPSRAEFTMPNK
jgi:serine/threonine protein kinase